MEDALLLNMIREIAEILRNYTNCFLVFQGLGFGVLGFRG